MAEAACKKYLAAGWVGGHNQGQHLMARHDFFPIPIWVSQIEAIELTPEQLEKLPEYSCTLPDSYKRPISDGGRPWKRDLNVFGRFAPPGEKIWIYCE